MPELPEVETTKRGIEKLVCGRQIKQVKVHRYDLRWPIPANLSTLLKGNTFERIDRRAKYLLFNTTKGTMIAHLGMSGKFLVSPEGTQPEKHDHVEFIFKDGQILRFNDPRRFGTIQWTAEPPEQHSLLSSLGPEPFDDIFDGDYLFRLSRGKQVAVKNFVMTNQVVVGVGNIYANEALFKAGIRPSKAAGKVTRKKYEILAAEIKVTLKAAIASGGTTLKDYYNSNHQPGYFSIQLQAYGRDGEPCTKCGGEIQKTVIGQRSTFFCKTCQK